MKKAAAFIIAALMLLPLITACDGQTAPETTAARETGTAALTEQSATTAPGPDAPADGEVGALRVNYEKDPVCVDEAPVFSWALGSDRRGASQSSYRVTVASSEADLTSGKYVWDSGEVASDISVGIKYEGELKSASAYFWRVTVKTDDGTVIKSDTAKFTTGLLKDGFDGAKWITAGNGVSLQEACWIWNYGNNEHGKIPEGTQYFRKSFACDVNDIESAVLIFTADDYGAAYLNGEKVIDKPNVTDGWKTGACVDVTDKIKESNTLAAYAVNTGIGYGGIIAKLVVTYKNGDVKTVLTDGSWKFSGSGPDGWYLPGFDDSAWKNPDHSIKYGEDPWGNNVVFGSSGGSAPMMRCEFDVEKEISSAYLYATAAGLYVPYLNGEKVGDTALDPGRSEYQVRLMYQSYDVTDLLKVGGNALGAMLGRGWYIGAYSPYGGSVPAFICKLVINYKDGSNGTVVSGGDWKAYLEGPVTYDDIFNGENYDARKEQDGWCAAGYNDGAWQSVGITTASELGIGKITAQLSGQVKIMDTVAVKEVTNPAKNTYIYDFGQNLAGVVKIKVKGKAGTTVKLRHGEMLNDGNNGSDGAKGTLYTTNLRSAAATDNYTLRGLEGGEEYTPLFTFHGFRYLEITGLTEPLPKEDVAALVLYSDMEDTGTLTTSDELINQLISNTYWGQRGNFLSTPTDCPQRDERMGWSGDAQIFCGTAAYNMNVKTFFDKYITDLNDCQRDNGAYTDVAPGANRAQYTGSGNSAWGDAGVIIPWIMYTRYGDASYIVKYYGNMKKYISYLLSVSTNYIKSNSAYGDWLSIGETTSMAITDTAYCAYVCDLMAKMAELIGKTSDAEKFKGYSENYKKAWCDRFLKDGKINGGTQTAYVVGLYFEIIPEDQREKAAANLNTKIKRNGNKLSTGFIGVSYLLPVLCKYGYTDTAFTLLQQTEYPSWLYPVLQGATTIWERWNSYTIEGGFGNAGMNSFNHYSYGSVTEWMYSYLAGITCDKDSPAFKHFILQPTVGGTITDVSGEYESMYGTIKSAWKAADGKMTAYTCTVPANTTATLYLPKYEDCSIFESGADVKLAEGVTFVSESDGVIKLELASGNYNFEIK